MFKPILIALLFATLILQLSCTELDKPTVGLYVASKRGDIDQIERHIYWKSDINQLNPDGQTPLHEAASAGRIIVAKMLLQNGAEVNKLNKQGQTALFVALINGRTQLADLLIKKFNAEFDATGLLFGVSRNNVRDRDVISFLTARGADINSLDDKGDTPLIIAIKNQQRHLAKYLIANKADVNMANRDNLLPLDIAAQLNNRDLIVLLQSNGARSTTPP